MDKALAYGARDSRFSKEIDDDEESANFSKI
jgi:hypothetical protein